MTKQLATLDEQADYQADSSGDTDEHLWISVDINVGSLDCRAGFGQQCRLCHP
jgi:hypothetical protein